jgi:glucoamylase
MSANGSMSEQFNKTTGHPESAYDLTWSLASFVTMARRREGNYPPSWGAKHATPAPTTCKGTSFISTNNYLPAFAALAPNVSLGCATEVLFKAYINNNVCRPLLSNLPASPPKISSPAS